MVSGDFPTYLDEASALRGRRPIDHGYGLVAMAQVPGADDVQLYQPRHPTAYDL